MFCMIVSCKDKEKDRLYDELNKGFENSNNVIEYLNQREYHTLADKLAKGISHEQATIWYPKAIKVKEKSESLFQQLEDIKNSIKKDSLQKQNNYFDKTVLHTLYNTLLKYKTEVLNVDSEVYYTFYNNLTITSGAFDSTEKTEKEFTELYFFMNTSSPKQLIATVSKLQNNIKITENAIITFCERKINNSFCGYDVFEDLVSLNYKHLKLGEKLEVTAGIGSFSTLVLPQIFINGKKRNLNAEGFVKYKINVPNKPGKYFIPVKINFKKPDGTNATLKKQIEYNVDE